MSYIPDENGVKHQIIKFKNGAIYDGQLRGVIREGKGTQIWPDGTKYDGEWKENNAWGYGKFTHKNGDSYEGQWFNGEACG